MAGRKSQHELNT